MKIRGTLFISALIILSSCASLRKGSSQLSKADVVNSNNEPRPPKVEVKTTPQPVIETERVTAPEKSVGEVTPNILVREERVTNVDTNELDYNYYVIIGSFQSLDNAFNFRSQLMNEGFVPVILESEIGFYRVSIAAFNEEQPTRARISQIRAQYPVYNDVWLLKKRK